MSRRDSSLISDRPYTGSMRLLGVLLWHNDEDDKRPCQVVPAMSCCPEGAGPRDKSHPFPLKGARAW
jgi:hypothetical protein